MSSTSNDEQPALQLLPKLNIYVLDKDPLVIGGLDNTDAISEINFYSRLNSFALNADITIEDVENQVLNLLSEPNAAKATISLYELPEGNFSAGDKLSTKTAKKVFQKTFSVNDIEVLKFSTVFPQKSIIKIKLYDIFDSLILNKLLPFSNFNLKWDSSEMNVDVIMHRILRNYERHAGKLVIPPDIFGVETAKLKRRFATSRSATLKDAFEEYIDGLYDTRWREYLTNASPIQDIPHTMLAFSNLYTLDNSGVMRQRPYLTTANLLDNNPDSPVYSIPYPKSGRILDFARKDYNVCIENTTIDLRGGPHGTLKDKLIALSYVKHMFDPKTGVFEKKISSINDIYQLNPKTDPDIKSRQDPPYLGVGEDPQFTQMTDSNKSILLKYPFNVKENQYYYANGENSFYSDMCEMLLKPAIYVSLPFSAWHSPGQEIDLRMITSNYSNMQPDKELLFSMNKLVSGRWKIVNSVTSLKQSSNPSEFGLTPVETVGLSRTKYFHNDKA